MNGLLKPCPFCGRKVEYFGNHEESGPGGMYPVDFYIWCAKCSVTFSFISEEKANKIWNKRK